jgi:NADH:ubiquinone oxidoreductase subunit 3 (subunit A)
MPATLERPKARTKPHDRTTGFASTPSLRKSRPQHDQKATRPNRPASQRSLELVPRTNEALLKRQVVNVPRPTKRQRSALARFFSESPSIEKAFTLLSFLVAITLFVVCSLDLAIAWPWMRASRLFDWTFLVCALIFLVLTFDVFRDQTHMKR